MANRSKFATHSMCLAAVVFLILSGAACTKKEAMEDEASKVESTAKAKAPKQASPGQLRIAKEDSVISLTRAYNASSSDSTDNLKWESAISIKITGKAKELQADAYQLENPTIEWNIRKLHSTTPISGYCRNEMQTLGSGTATAAELQQKFVIFKSLYADTGKITISLQKDGTYRVNGYVAVPVDVKTTSTIREDLTGASYSCGWVKVDGPPGMTNEDSSKGQIRYALPITGTSAPGSKRLEGSGNYDGALMELDTGEKARGPEAEKTWTTSWTINLPAE